jgi:uncharacterized protein (TIGR02118 family)
LATLIVSYPNREGAKFDRAYYKATHMPLLDEHWADTGFLNWEALFPTDEGQPFAAMAVLRFRDQAAIDASLSAPGTAAVMGDVPNFTDLVPTLFRAGD